MSKVVPARSAHPRRVQRNADSTSLRHWSEVSPPLVNEPPPPRVTPAIATLLRDLVAWAADLAITLTNGCPDDRAAIAQVRAYAEARLTGEPCPELELHDVLTTAAVLMSGIDLRLHRATSHPDDADRCAIGAALIA